MTACKILLMAIKIEFLRENFMLTRLDNKILSTDEKAINISQRVK